MRNRKNIIEARKAIEEKNKFSMTTCTRTGIKINNTGNDYTHNPFAGIDPFKNQAKN